MAFESVKVQSNSKLYQHRYNIDVNTTHNFGFVQPIFCRKYDQGESARLTLNEVLRLAPMPSPSFARVRLDTCASFVPMSEIFPAYDNLRSGLPYCNGIDTYVPNKVPTVTNMFLVAYLLNKYGQVNSYRYNESLKELFDPIAPTVSDVGNFLNVFWKNSNMSSPFTLDDKWGQDITPENADFIIKQNGSDENDTYYHLFKLNDKGRLLRKVFIGLGFNLTIANDEPLSFLPLLAFYKAYFDKYYPTRDISFQDTAAFKIIKSLESNKSSYLTLNNGTFLDAVLNDFFEELADCYATMDQDFLSAHRDYPMSSSGSSPVFNDGDEVGIQYDIYQDPVYSSRAISNVVLKAIQRVTSFVKTDTYIGKKLSSWLKAHLGTDISNSIERDSHNIGMFSLDAQIQDIYSTSDTANTQSGDGDYLGAYAGKGLGYNKGNFSYEFKEVGFFIVFQAVIPTSGYYQGCDEQLYEIDRDSIFYPEYDGLGYEVNPQSMFFCDNGVYKDEKSQMSGSFGFLPRYSSLRAKHNICNGDMSLRSRIDSYSSYFLDRIFSFNNVYFKPKDGQTDKWTVDESNEREPVAGVQYRFINKDKGFGNYDRIFYNSGYVSKGVTPSSSDDSNMDDNFICQVNIFLDESTRKLPSSLTYDTLIDEIDSNIKEIETE